MKQTLIQPLAITFISHCTDNWSGPYKMHSKMFFLPDFGLRLKTERKRLGVNQEEMAKMLGVTRNVVVSYEAGKTSPTVGSIYNAATYGLDPVFVIAGMSSHAFISDEEQILLNYFNNFSDRDRQTVLGIVAVIAGDVAGFHSMMQATPSLATLQRPQRGCSSVPIND